MSTPTTNSTAPQNIQFPFDQNDINEIIDNLGVKHSNIYISRAASKNLIDMAKFFIEEVLDVKKSGAQLQKADIQKQINSKFPQIGGKKTQKNFEIMAKRYAELQKLDDRVGLKQAK